MSAPLKATDRQRREPTSPPEVRQLKPPPEIWELVHPVEPQRKRRGQRGVSWTTFVLIAFGIGLIGGGAAALWKSPEARAFISESFGLQQTPQSQPRAVESNAAKTEPATTQSAPVEQNDTAATTSPTQVTPSETELPKEASLASESASALEPESVVTVPPARVNRPLIKKPQVRQPSGEANLSATGARVGSAANTAQPKSPEGGTKVSSDTGATKSNATSNQQVIAPVKPSQGSKPKVIDWP